jgi:hypothetical protein
MSRATPENEDRDVDTGDAITMLSGPVCPVKAISDNFRANAFSRLRQDGGRHRTTAVMMSSERSISCSICDRPKEVPKGRDPSLRTGDSHVALPRLLPVVGGERISPGYNWLDESATESMGDAKNKSDDRTQ